MIKKIVLGSFNAEKFWRSEKYSELPQINDKNAINIINSMDELLFPLCSRDDVLLSRFSLNQTFKKYLEEIGFNFHNNTKDLQKANEKINEESDIFELLYLNHKDDYFKNLFSESDYLDSYAVLPNIKKVCEKYNLKHTYPDIEIIKLVNSKIYSHKLHDRLGIKKYGDIANTSLEMEDIISKSYNNKTFLIKDIYGVSGKGNILISSQGMFKRILKHLSSQEECGHNTCFLIEPYLEKETDFSCQIHIDNNGNHEILSIQKMHNTGFSYYGSTSAEPEFKNYLYEQKYFQYMDKIAIELFKDGYFGDVCIDSMILKNGEIVPLVEINARKSMGLINYYLDKFLKNFSCKGHFIFFYLGFKGNIRFEDIINKFEKENILFKANNRKGIIPLSCKTLFVNRDMDSSFENEKIYKGRLYISSVSNKTEERLNNIEKTKEILKSMAFNIYN